MKVLTFLGFLAVGAIAVLWGGYVLSILWGWFMIPVFGLPALTAMQAAGVKLTVRVITYTHRREEEKDDWLITSFVEATILPLVLLGLGWIIQHWV